MDFNINNLIGKYSFMIGKTRAHFWEILSFPWIWQTMSLDILNWNLFGLILKQRLKSEDNSKMLDTSGIYFSAKLQN